MHALNRTPSSARADATIWASRMSWKGRTFDSRRDLTFSEIHRRVAWGIVGLLPGQATYCILVVSRCVARADLAKGPSGRAVASRPPRPGKNALAHHDLTLSMQSVEG